MDDENNTLDIGGYDSTYDVNMDTITLTGSGTTSITSPIYSSAIVGSGVNYTSPYTISTGITGSNYNWVTTPTTPTTVHINNDGIDMSAGADIKIDGKSLKEFMTKMEQRLSILVPDPKKLEKFEALQKAYNHYKMLEALCDIEDDTTK